MFFFGEIAFKATASSDFKYLLENVLSTFSNVSLEAAETDFLNLEA